VNLFVTNINYGADEEALRELFEPCGKIVRLYLVRDRETGASRGFAFVEFATTSAGHQAILTLNKTTFMGRMIYIREADPNRRPHA
jgi:RNA recognition motif-containing protein